jgi:CYTH domain-containing protein
MKSLELELTYLAATIPAEIRKATPQRLIDVYIPESSSFPVLRVRQRGDKYEITKKTPIKEGDFSAHTEHTIPLTKGEFEALKRSSLREVEKNRYTVKINGCIAEVDVFTGKLTGLVVLDFEFKTDQEKSRFTPPGCCLADVTQEKFILGGQLAGKSYADIQSELKRFNYRELSL